MSLVANILTNVLVSGQVEMFNQFKLPTNICMKCVNFLWLGDGGGFGIVYIVLSWMDLVIDKSVKVCMVV